MARTGALKHTHQYFKRQDKKWACLRDGCTHFMPSTMYPAPLGSMSICWTCGNEFRLLQANMKEDRPSCDPCMELNEEIERKYGIGKEDEIIRPDSDAVLRRYGIVPKKDEPTSE